MWSPLCASTGDKRTVTLPSGNTGAGEPSTRAQRGSPPRRTSKSPGGKFRERESIRENWGRKFCAGNTNLSLPRPGELTPRPPKTVGSNALAVVPNVDDVNATVCGNYGGKFDHILGAGIKPRGITRSNVPMYPRTDVSEFKSPMAQGIGRDKRPGVSSAPSTVSKSVDQQVSKTAEPQEEPSLTDAQLRETTGLECVRYALEKCKKIMEGHKFLQEEREKMKQEEVLKAERWRKPNPKSHGEWDAWDEAAEMARLEALEREHKNVDPMSDVEPDDPVSVATDANASETRSIVPETSVPISAEVTSNPEFVVISSDENNNSDKDKGVVDDIDLNAIGMEVAESLWGVVFDILADVDVVLGTKNSHRIERTDDFGNMI